MKVCVGRNSSTVWIAGATSPPAYLIVKDYCETIGRVASVEKLLSDMLVHFEDVSDALMAESLLNQRIVADCTLRVCVQPFLPVGSLQLHSRLPRHRQEWDGDGRARGSRHEDGTQSWLWVCHDGVGGGGSRRESDAERRPSPEQAAAGQV